MEQAPGAHVTPSDVYRRPRIPSAYWSWPGPFQAMTKPPFGNPAVAGSCWLPPVYMLAPKLGPTGMPS